MEVEIGEHLGLWSLIPPITAVVVALITRRAFAALLFACLVGYVMLQFMGELGEGGPLNFFRTFSEDINKVGSDPVNVWIILVCGLFGSVIALLIKSRASIAFGNYLTRYVKSKKSALFTAWLLGVIIFMDDYLNALTVSSAMRKVTDKFKVSREMLAYVVDSTGAPICVLLPFSTWAVFVGGILVQQGIADEGSNGLMAFASTIPYNIYAWVALIVVLLVAVGIIPPLGPMKKAERRAEETGQMAPDGSEEITLIPDEVEAEGDAKPKLFNFVIPILTLIIATLVLGSSYDGETGTITYGVDAYLGVLFTMFVMFFLFLGQRLMSIATFFETTFDGFKSMVYPLGIVMISFVLVEVNGRTGFTEFVIETIQPHASSNLLPVLAFLSLSLITFSTGSFWGVYAVSLPVMIPLGVALDVHMPLLLGAVISSGAFGSHMCPFGDTTVLSASGSGCQNMAHVLTQMPYGIISGIIAVIGFTTLGFIF